MVDGVACGCGPAPQLPRRIRREQLEELTQQTKLTHKEVQALYARFRRLAPSGHMLPEHFRQTMGVLGLTDDAFLPDRMFGVFDADQDGKLSFNEFAKSLAVMIRGTEDEKLKLSFEMTAGRRGAQGISLEDFERLIQACNTMMSSLVAPSGGLTSKEDVRRLFHELSSDEGECGNVITLEAYKAAAQGNDDFLMCLGMEPTSRARGGREGAGARNRGRLPTFRQAPGGPSPLGSPSPMPSPQPQPSGPPPGYVYVQTSQLDDLKERVARLNVLLQKKGIWDTLGTASSASSGEEVLSPDMRFMPPSRQAGSAKPATPLDEVCQELDRVLASGVLPPVPPMPPTTTLDLSGVAATYVGSSGAASTPTWGGMAATLPAAAFQEVPPGRSSPAVPSSSEPATPSASRDFDRGRQRPPPLDASNAKPAGRVSVTTPNGEVRLRMTRTMTMGHTSTKQKRQHRLLGPKKGLAVHFGHESWNMVLSMMIGIRMSVGRCRHEISRELQPVDFIMQEKFSIIPRLANIFDSAVSKRVTVTRFIDYAPMVFQKIRSSFGIHYDDYLRSVGPEQLLGNMVLGNLSSLSELSSEGKSGAFFYYTADGHYMLKTVAPKEFVLLRSILKQYHDHIIQNPGTLIVRFLGLHCLRVHENRRGIPMLPQSKTNLYFVVMANMFNAPFEIHRRYDLKGSWVGRLTPPEKREPGVALKDEDFKESGEKVCIGEERKSRMIAQLQSDSAFLARSNIIDYSLLLGVHDRVEGENLVGDDTVSEAGSMPQPQLLGLPVGATSSRGRGPPSPMSEVSPLQRQLTGQTQGLAPNESALDVPLHRRDMGGMLSSDQDALYFMGVIDILTPYDTFKKFEHHLKALRHDRRGVSCCPPDMYAERFTKFMQNVFE